VPEKRTRDPFRLAVFALGWLAAFALLFTLGEGLGVWPLAPPAALRGSDLVAGAAFAALLLFLLLLAVRRRGR